MSVGIDIGTKSIKVVETSMEAGKPVLKAAGIIGVKDASIDKIQTDAELANLANIIKQLLQNTNVTHKNINISLPESLVFTRTLRLPLLTDSEIASAVKWQAEDIIPIPLKETIFQHTVLERNEGAQPPEVLVLVVAAPRTLVEKYVKLMSIVGRNIVAVETELIAASRVLAPENETAILLNLGSKATDIAITRNKKLVFSRSIPTGGDALTRAVVQSMNISLQQAEEYKRTYGLSASQLEGKVGNAIKPIFNILLEEIKKAIRFYQTDEKGDAPSTIILLGGGAGLPDIASSLSKAVGGEVVIANPFAKIRVEPDMAHTLTSYAPLYPVAVGLSLREE